MKTFRIGVLFLLLAIFCQALTYAQTQKESFSEGAFIINCGIEPQTRENSLQVYGLLFELLNEQPVEIKWIINPEKQKDGVDFTYSGTDYKSGAFLLPVSYINAEVEEVIQAWQKRGVVGVFTEERLELPVYNTLTMAPKWTLDRENGFIAVPFFRAAGIPESAHGGIKSANWKRPEELGVCDDIFVMPHADPAFETHKNLYFWNRDFKGAIWAGCHAVSKLESLFGNLKNSDELIQLNFLSAGFPGARSAGLLHYRKHRHGTPPYEYHFPADPVAQFLGKADQAHLNGSERIFFPKPVNKWRPATRILISDPDAPDIPEKSDGEAVVTAYGHAFENPKNGLVMYQAGHNIFGNSPANIAALRAFFNWSFLAAEIKRKENLIVFHDNASGSPVIGAKIGDDLTRVLNLKPIHFDLDKSEIRKDAVSELTRIAEFMQKYPELLLDIRSHTDSRANDDYNLELSEARVKETRAFLEARGVESHRISGRGYGETELINNCRNGVNCAENEHQKNRRSEFILSINCNIYSGRSDYILE
ncbi:OmpA family protein [Salegentibacter sp. HM20]